MPNKSRATAKAAKTTKAVEPAGQLPAIYEGFVKDFPEIIQAVDNLAEQCQKAGNLNKKTIELIKLGIAIGQNSEGSVRSHARRALEAGNSPQNIRQVVLLGLTTVGFPHTIASYKWVEEVLKGPRT